MNQNREGVVTWEEKKSGVLTMLERTKLLRKPFRAKNLQLTENQLKVIKDKYLRDAKNPEEWLRAVARNIALAELFYHPHFEEWHAFDGVSHTTSDKTFFVHTGLHKAGDRDKNFNHLIANLNRIAHEIPEAHQLVEEWEECFYDMLSSFDFLPNSPTLMNAGRELQQLSACYVLPVEDSMEGITYALMAQSLIQKSGGGTGFSFGRLRPSGDLVKKTKGVASGAISFMQIFDKMTDVIKQGSTRRGANMGILPYWHPEIKEFITMKTKPGVMENFNVSIAVDAKFIQTAREGKDYELLNPRTKEVVGKANAKEIFDLIVDCAWKTGDPGLFIIDRTNESASNPTPSLYSVESTNPCFAGDVRLATNRGLLTFEELFIDQSVISVATDNRVIDINILEGSGATATKIRMETGTAFRQAVPVFKTRKNWPVFRLTTTHGYEVVATEDHKFFTPIGTKELRGLKPGDEILIQSGRGKWSLNDNLPPFEPAEKLLGRIKRGKCHLPKKWTKDLGKLLGWVIGDGYVTKDILRKNSNVPGHTVGLMFGDEEKKLLVPIFQRLIREWLGLEGHLHEWKTGLVTLFYKSALYYFLKSLGLSDADGLHKTVPASLWRAPQETIVGFLSALFTADGTVNISRKIHYGSIRLANSSKKLLQEVQTLLLNEGIVSQLYLRRKAGQKLMPDSKRKPKLYPFANQYELVITKENRLRFLKQIGFLTQKKQQKALAWESALTKGAYQETFVTQVKNVESAGQADVYCTTEKETHSLIANGFVAGNCGEKPLYPWEPCNLGSINLSNFVEGPVTQGAINWERLENTVKIAVRFLDDVIDVNNYPLPEIEEMAKNLRRIGLGVMGWAEMLVKLGHPYDSDKAVTCAKEVMKFINDKALEESEALAKERGVFPLWKESIYNPEGPCFGGQASMPRNCVRTTIAPTGTIGIAAGLQGGGIEPFFAIAYTRYNAKALEAIRNNQEPDPKDIFVEVNPLFLQVAKDNDYFGLNRDVLFKKIDANHKSVRDISEIPQEIRAIFASAHDISIDYHVKMQAAFQEFTDDGVSKTINMSHAATREDIKRAYLMAYDSGCKGITIYRDGCKADQVLNLNPLDRRKQKKESPFGASSEYYEVKTGYGTLHIHINFDEQGPYRIFTSLPPLGTEISGLTSILGILLSKYLETGGDPIRILKHLNSVKGDRPYGFGENRIDSIPHAVAVALKAHLKKTGRLPQGQNGVAVQPVKDNGTASETGLELWEIAKAAYCPKCFSSNVSFQSGCHGPVCHECGHSECG